jgi:large subunit ribosomal protein L9
MMEVILLERIEKLGQMGEEVNVKTGFARNYLLPKNKAVRATDENRMRFQEQRVQLEARNLERKAEAEKVAEPLKGLSVVLIRQAGESGQLYGSVNARDIAQAVTEAGASIGRQQVSLNTPIKALGMHSVSVNLHPEVAIEVTVNVARSPDEAETQARTGRAVGRFDEQEEEEEEARAAELEAQANAVFEEEVAGDATGEPAPDESADDESSVEAETSPPRE